jgi:hypothetical protein
MSSPMATALTPINESTNTKTWAITALHTAAKPCTVTQKRKLAPGATQVREDSLLFSQATVDADGKPIASRYSVQVIVRAPNDGTLADQGDLMGVFYDIVVSTEFEDLVANSFYVKLPLDMLLCGLLIAVIAVTTLYANLYIIT